MSTGTGTRFGRAEALEMLARYGDRSPEQVDEHLGSLELTWLIAQAEQVYGVQLDLDDERLDAIRTVDDAVAALGSLIDTAADAAADATGSGTGGGGGGGGGSGTDAGAAAP
ncbi:hypothetical protein GCM10009759_50270 [Kitasatospora saccharophila]|uniref:Acyl carrier protein n=1 Tax=Kitasatospora saccharophila TaxID=407973 RepID=A0ABN2XE44_9ACTN